MSLLDVLRGVMLDPAEQAAYNADPSAYLGQYGYDDVDPADLSEAFGLVADTLPPEQAQAGLSVATTPDDSSFGAVTADFDGDAVVANGAAPAAGASVGLDDLDDLDIADDATGDSALDLDLDEPASAGDGGDGPGLSFGDGHADPGELDDATFGESATGLDDLDAGTDLPDGLDVLDLDDLGDTDTDAGTGDGGFGVDLDLGDDLGNDIDDGTDAGLGDTELDEAAAGLGDSDPDDFDIGSF